MASSGTPMASGEDSGDLSGAIARQLPYLRRFARALTGSQSTGDGYAAATLEAIVADRSVIDESLDAKEALFRVFHAIWSSSGAQVAEPGAAEGPLAEKAQDRLSGLAPAARVAVLLSSLEGFGNPAIARVMQVSEDEAARLVALGWDEMDRQLAARVLIIEDEPVIAMDLESIVEGLGHAVAATTDTRDRAVEAAMAEKPDLVLADIQLADGSSGIDAVHDILAAFGVPVIFITAYPERLLTGERPEPAYLITKPFQEAQLRAAIGQALFFGSVVDEV